MQSQFIQTRDLRMHYRQNGTGEPVIFIHGFPETSYEWRHQLARFGADYACFAPDTRGYGETDKPGIRVTRQLLAQDIINFMDALGIAKAAVVAHDWGGIIGFKLAIDWPERVTRLALLDTLCTVWTPQGIHGYWFKAAPYPEEFFAEYYAEFIEAIATGSPSRPLPGRPHSPWQTGPVAAPARARWADADTVREYQKAFADPLSHFHAISYYRYALPFHKVIADPLAPRGERYEFLAEKAVADIWNHADGMDKHPDYAYYMDYGPEDRHKRFNSPTLWMFAGAPADRNAPDPRIPKGNPFVDQFGRYFPDLRARQVAGGHFFPEENPTMTNAVLAEFLANRI